MLPVRAGIYLHKNEAGKILYVGKAKNLRNRVRQYFQSSRHHDAKTRRLVKAIVDFEFIVVDNEVEALVLESNLIKKHKPRFNVLLKDDIGRAERGKMRARHPRMGAPGLEDHFPQLQ